MQLHINLKKTCNIPNIIGAIDGSYISIKASKVNVEIYINRKCFYVITLQGICDASMKFIDCFAGYLSSMNDPALQWLIPPYIDRENLNAVHRRFNETLSKGRHVIERAFAFLKSRFRRLKYLDMNRTDLIPVTIF